MKLIIDMPEETLREVNRCGLFLCPRDKERLINSIKHGTPIPENATNGDMIKALFPTCKFDNALPFTDGRWETVEFETDSKYKPTQLRTYDNWCNSPYKRGDME